MDRVANKIWKTTELSWAECTDSYTFYLPLSSLLLGFVCARSIYIFVIFLRIPQRTQINSIFVSISIRMLKTFFDLFFVSFVRLLILCSDDCVHLSFDFTIFWICFRPLPSQWFNSFFCVFWISHRNRYKCHSCEQPDCRESPEGTRACEDAILCWKSRTRNADGLETVSRGCIVEHDKLPFFCNYQRNSRSARAASGQFNIECCHGDYCNNGTFPELPPVTGDDNDATRLDHGHNKFLLSIAILGPVLIVVIFLAIIVPMRRSHQKRLLSMRNKQDTEAYYAGDELLRVTSAGDSTLKVSIIDGTGSMDWLTFQIIFLQDFMQQSMTSGSGSGLPLLIQRTLTKQVALSHEIGRGRYGKVYLGNWHGDKIAVKIFYSRDEESWKRETEVYSTTLLRHENILRYIGSDMTSHNSSTQLWVLTDFYPLGSLYDQLQRKAPTRNEMLTICQSIINGLVHLHSEFMGTESKTAIAHRDLKSKNILIRENNVCVIADFGLAAMHTRDKLDLGTNPRVGTKRYMSPEILDQR